MHGAREHSRAQAVSTSRGRDSRSWAGGPSPSSSSSSSVGPGRWCDGGHGTERWCWGEPWYGTRVYFSTCFTRNGGRWGCMEQFARWRRGRYASLRYTGRYGPESTCAGLGWAAAQSCCVPRSSFLVLRGALQPGCRRSQSAIVSLDPGPSFPLSACLPDPGSPELSMTWMMNGWIVPSTAHVFS